MENTQSNPLMDFYKQLPPELQEKIKVLPPEKQQEVLMQLMQKYQEQSQGQQFAEGGEVDPQQIMQIVAQALQQGMQPEEVVKMLVEQGVSQEQAVQIIQQVMQSTQQPEQEQQFAMGGQTKGIPVEAEKNENVTVQDGQQPEVEGGYVEQQSHNPVTGQSTYEIPDNEYNNSHEQTGNGSDQTGVNMELAEGDVINSNKTKIPTDFKVYGKSFKGKTFKDASDYLSKQETKIQDDFAKKVKEGKTDKVSEGALQIMLAKLGKNRDELNELQEQVLESKKQKEANESLKSGLAEYGKVVLEMNKAEHGFNTSLDRYLNYKVTDRPVLKASDGLTASLEKFSKFADKVTSNKNASLQDIMSAYNQSGLSFNPKESTAYYKPTFQPINGSQIVGDFKTKIAQKETGAYKNPYIAIAGINEKDASSHSFDELKSKAASSGIGKYQFLWNLHKGDIKRITGISKPDDFRYNPQAQEQFMDWFRDNTLLPQATELKQKYELPMSIDQIMAMTHLEGKAGLEKKIKSGTLKTSTMANNFKNASPVDYAFQFKQGGKAKSGVWNNFEPIDYNRADDYPDAERISGGLQDLKNPENGKIYIYDERLFQYNNGKFNEYYTSEEKKQALEFRGKQEANKTSIPSEISNPITNMLYNTDSPYREFIRKQKFQVGGDEYKYGGYAKDGFNFSTSAGNKVDFTKVSDFNNENWQNLNVDAKETFGQSFDNPGQYQDYMLKNYPELVRTMFDKGFWSNTNQGEEIPTSTVPFDDEELYKAFRDNKFNRRGFIPKTKAFDNLSVYEEYIKGKTKSGSNYYFDPELNTWVSPDLSENNYTPQSSTTTIVPTIDNRDNLNRSKVRTPNNRVGAEKFNENSKEDQNKNKTSWRDKLKYGIRESLPYLRNLALMNEDTINPILQQKSYQNPYDNMNTDYSIQSALNDSDRSTLTAMADERGNPSVRSARLAQIAANAVAAKAPLYTQKYNQEQQLQNQKVVGQSQYLNQWEDVNRGLKKDFEHEVLQTREVQRQQKNMAIDSMMNNYLRKQEEKQAINLSLLETNYDWNPYTGKYEFNKEKAAQNFAEKKYLAKNKQSGNSKIIEGADGESYEVITPKSGKPIIRKIEKKYGGKVVKY